MTQKNARRFTVRAAAWGAKLLGHLLATTVVFSIFGLLFMTESALLVLDVGLLDSQISERLVTELGLIFGVSACFWALLFIAFQLAREAKASRKRMSLVKARGTILTETLIVLPVFFLLTFGLCQMGVNSMAGLLTTLGTYQAARTVAVWGPEEGHNRSGNGEVTSEIVRDKARVAAAGVIAPVTPSLLKGNNCDTDSKTLNDFLKSLTGAGVNPSESAALGLGGGQAYRWSLVDALDTGNFSDRAWFKMKGAYCSVTVTHTDVITDEDSNARNTIETTVVYAHPSIFPLVGPIFDTGHDGAANNPWTGSSVAAITRTYELTQQISPNPELPKKGALSSVLSGALGGLP